MKTDISFLWKLALVLYFTIAIAEVRAIETKDFDTYTDEELKLIPQLRGKVANGLTRLYMSQNKYLVRFLRAANLNVDKAEKIMRENFVWRKRYTVDDLSFRNFTKMSKRFPFHFTTDKTGRPALVSALYDVNVRQMILAGDVALLRYYIIHAIDRWLWNIHLVSHRTGRELIGGYLLYNMAGFNLRNQACAGCIPLWIELAASYEKFYPQLAYKMIVVNTPRIFQTVFAAMKPFITGHTLSGLQLLSVDRTEWEPILLKDFDKGQLTREFGGKLPQQRLGPPSHEDYVIMLGPNYKQFHPIEIAKANLIKQA